MSVDFKPELKPLRDDACAGGGGCPGGLGLPVPGFWPRATALAIDVGLLTTVFFFAVREGFAGLYPFREVLQPLAALLVYAYFLAGASRLTGGQTLGKKMMQIRTVDARGGALRWPTAAARAAVALALVYAHVSFAAPFLFPHSIFQYPMNAPGLISLAVLGYLAGAYAGATAIYCGLHPRRRALHDLWLGTAVVRAGEEDAGIAFIHLEDEASCARTRLAAWPAGAMATIFLFLLGAVLFRNLPDITRELAVQQEVSRRLAVSGFSRANVTLPSPELVKRFRGDLEAAQAARLRRNSDPLTSASLRLAPTGRKFHFTLQCSEIFTSVTLTADPRYAEVVARMRPLAAELARSQGVPGAPLDYPEGVQAEFLLTLPCFLYSGVRPVYADILPTTDTLQSGR